ncbi:glycosyltransferase [Eubacteriales bacterium OttesenSCG-928-K08]|nr:glycosyltransferase [Eubacteriales bacterium OttesenSCG-928-K08]
MRIAQCNDAFLPIIDGVGRVVYEYANALGERGHEVYVVAPMSKAGYRQKYPFEILDYVSVALPGAAQYRTGVASLDRHYLARVEEVQFDLIHAHSPGPSGLEAVRLANKLHVPLIATFHTRYHEDFMRFTKSESLSALGTKYVVDFYDRCDEVWAVSEFAKRELQSYGYKGRIEIVPHGTREPQITQAHELIAREHFSLDDRPILLYVGQIDWKKNLRLSLEAMAKLKARGHDFLYVLAGKGASVGGVIDCARELGIEDNIKLTGHITDNSLLNGLYKAAELFVFPSSYDTAGLVVREAAAVGVPSVVLKNSAPSECIKDGITGYTCEEDASCLANAIERALSDRRALKMVGRQAQTHIPVSWETVMDDVEARYNALAATEQKDLKRKRGIFRKELDAIDKTLEKRKMSMMWHFLKQDMQHVYAYPYAAQKPARERGESKPLPRATPESMGIKSRDLLAFFHTVDADTAAGVQAMMVLRHGNVIAEGYWAPHEKGMPHQLYSMSKSITSTAIGMLVDENKLKLTERLVDIFADKIENPIDHPMANITVWHLLTMSTGARFDEVGTALGEDWVREYLDSGVSFEAGTQFYYNSLNTYMLSAIVRRKAKQSMMEYLTPRLFEPLEIAGVQWETCPLGIEKGGWGLSLALEDAAKIGQLYLQKGEWTLGDGKKVRLISREWIEAATSRQIKTPSGEMRDGYGYQIWMGHTPGSYMFNGAFGQYLIMLPHEDAVVAVFSGTSRLFAQGSMSYYVEDCFENASDKPLEENPAELRMLSGALENLSLMDQQTLSDQNVMPISLRWITRHINGHRYHFETNAGGLLPMVLQSVHNNYTSGIIRTAFDIEEDGSLKICWEESGGRNEFFATHNSFTTTKLYIRDDVYDVAVGAVAGLSNDGVPLLRLYIYYLETPCVRIITMRLGEDSVDVEFDERPSVNDAMGMLLELSGTTHWEFYRTIMPLLKRESLQSRLRTLAIATASGNRE